MACLSLLSPLRGQAPSRVLLHAATGVNAKAIAEFAGISPDSVAVVDQEFGLYLFSLRAGQQTGQICGRISACRGVISCQTLKQVQRRRTPDDPLFGRQRFLNTIQATLAWNASTGGLNSRGDTLVVAIVDDGMDTLHPDLLPNAWFNRKEIPFNGIDDDLNGYTDDYRGWNGGDTNGQTFTTQSLYSHGTHVSGIIGASGNNAVGVSGINWRIKMMPLLCYPKNGIDADLGVIRCMIYALRMKKLYLSSGGTQGAMIVALNTSVGIDRARPSDEPVWCALYDSLGKYGIISSVATTNSNIDIGKEGDIPGLCASRYTLVVSNTDPEDNRVNSGFSDTFVDLSAPGQFSYSTALLSFSGPNGPYNEQSGSSFAAPQVGASAALLMSGACDTFWSVYRAYPDSAVMLVHGWIMAGTKKLSVLNGLNVSGGRLDLYEAFRQMEKWCKSLQPAAPGFSMFPNPAAAGSWLQINGTGDAGTLELFSLSGQVCMPLKEIKAGRVFLPELSAGVYVARVQSSEGTIIARLLITN